MYVIEFDNVIGDEKLPSYVRELATTIKVKGYCTVGDFFKSLYQYDIEELIQFSNKANNEDDHYSNYVLLLLTMLLNSGEGSSPESLEENLDIKFMMLNALINCVSLEHKGLAECIYENFSLQSDTNHLPVIKAL